MVRGKIGIIADILKAAEKSVLQDHIIIKCNLSTKQSKEYIPLLIQKGLLNAFPLGHMRHIPGRQNRHRMTYQTTKTGKQFLRLYAEMSALVEKRATTLFGEKSSFLLSAKIGVARSTDKRCLN